MTAAPPFSREIDAKRVARTLLHGRGSNHSNNAGKQGSTDRTPGAPNFGVIRVRVWVTDVKNAIVYGGGEVSD